MRLPRLGFGEGEACTGLVLPPLHPALHFYPSPSETPASVWLPQPLCGSPFLGFYLLTSPSFPCPLQVFQSSSIYFQSLKQLHMGAAVTLVKEKYESVEHTGHGRQMSPLCYSEQRMYSGAFCQRSTCTASGRLHTLCCRRHTKNADHRQSVL